MMLMHSAVNQSIGIVSSAVPGASDVFALSTSPLAWITAGTLWAFAIYALARMPQSIDADRRSLRASRAAIGAATKTVE